MTNHILKNHIDLVTNVFMKPRDLPQQESNEGEKISKIQHFLSAKNTSPKTIWRDW